MNAKYIWIDLLRNVRSVPTIAFIFVMPSFMYLLFGATAGYGDLTVGHGNNKFYVMAAMGAYGAATAAVSISSMAATEAMLGWGRQLSLTRQPASGYVANKVTVAVVIAMVAQVLTYAVGIATGAKADISVWWATFLISLAGSTLFAVYGLAMGLLFRSEAASGVATSSLVFLAFLGNVFTPLSGFMLALSKWTPMYGYIGLVRWPQLEGELLQTSADAPPPGDPMWLLVVNLVAWLAVFVVLALLGMRRARTRR